MKWLDIKDNRGKYNVYKSFSSLKLVQKHY
jgi:hypothetical protein